MPFFREHRCIFAHQRKCAGTSIISMFGALTPEDRSYFVDGILSKAWKNDREFISSHVTFAVVRNPWTRFISGWRYCDSTKNRPLKDVLRELPQSGHDYRHLTRQQCDTLVSPDGEFAVQHLLRYERLQEDFDNLCDIIKKPRDRLPHHKASGETIDYRAVFDDEAQEMFRANFARDIEVLGYSFSPDPPTRVFG